MNLVIEIMCRSFFQSLTMFAILKVYSFVLRKSTILHISYWKERNAMSIVAKRGNMYILLQSRVVFSIFSR